MSSRHEETAITTTSTPARIQPATYSAAAALMSLKNISTMPTSQRTTEASKLTKTQIWTSRYPATNSNKNINNNNITAATAASSNKNTSNTTNSNNKNQDKQTSRSHENEDNYKPSRKFAIVFENTQKNVSQDEVLRAVADVIGGHHIHYCTRLTGGRTCLYLTNEQLVLKLCEEGGVICEGEFLQCRRYLSEAQKFVISNCPPELEDSELSKLLSEYGRMVSAPARLRVSTPHNDLKHVKTWRRSVFMLIPDDAPEMPKKLFITSPEGAKYTLYINKDEIVCNFCSRPGHIAEKCKSKADYQENFPAFTKTVSVSSRLIKKTNPPTDIISQAEKQPTFLPSFNKPEESPATEKRPENIIVPLSEPLISLWGDEMESSSNNIQIQEKTDSTPTELSDSVNKGQPNLIDIDEQPFFKDGILPQILSNKEDMITSDSSEASQNLMDLTSNELFERIKRKSREKRPLSISPESPQNTFKLPRTSTSPAQDQENKPQEDKEESAANTSLPESFSDLISETESNCSQDSKSSSQPTKSKKKAKEEAALNYVIDKMSFVDEFLSEEQFRAFLSKCRGKANSTKVAKSLTLNITTLMSSLHLAYTISNSQNLQRRLLRALNALQAESQD